MFFFHLLSNLVEILRTLITKNSLITELEQRCTWQTHFNFTFPLETLCKLSNFSNQSQKDIPSNTLRRLDNLKSQNFLVPKQVYSPWSVKLIPLSFFYKASLLLSQLFKRRMLSKFHKHRVLSHLWYDMNPTLLVMCTRVTLNVQRSESLN